MKVTLSADPERSVTVPLTATNQDGASSADYSGVPESVNFASGDTEKSFTFAATADTVDDDGESQSSWRSGLCRMASRRVRRTRAWSASPTTTCHP